MFDCFYARGLSTGSAIKCSCLVQSVCAARRGFTCVICFGSRHLLAFIKVKNNRKYFELNLIFGFFGFIFMECSVKPVGKCSIYPVFV